MNGPTMTMKIPASTKVQTRRSVLYPHDVEMRTVEILVQFCRIGEIDTMNEKFQAEIYIESRWTEKAFIENYDPKTNWNPCIYIDNAIQLAKEEINYYVTLLDDNTSSITEIRIVKGTFWERLELQNFPIDIQELSISLTTKHDSHVAKLIFDAHRLSFMNLDASNTFIDQQKWQLYKFVKTSEQASYDKHSHQTIGELSHWFIDYKLYRPFKRSKLVATCYCSRKPGYYLFNAYFLIFLITAAALTVFAVDCKLPQNRLQITCTVLLTSVSFKWVINRSLPTVSYLTSLDKYAITCIFYKCMLCVWHSLVGTFWIKDYAKQIDKWMLLFFSLLFVLINLGFLLWFCVAYRAIREIRFKEARFLTTFKEIQKKFVEMDF